MRKTTDGTRRGIRWKFTTCLEGPGFADDIVLISQFLDHAQNKVRVSVGSHDL